jgi:hypothetical protein
MRPMSAPSLIERVKTSLVGLKMPRRALEVLDVTLRGIERGEIGAVEAIDALLTEELTMRENRRIRMAVLMARLSAIKTRRFPLRLPAVARPKPHPGARRTAVHRPRRSGPFDSHLSLALGVEPVKAGRSVYFSSLADIDRDDALRQGIRYYCRFALLIVDKIGYLPLGPVRPSRLGLQQPLVNGAAIFLKVAPQNSPVWRVGDQPWARSADRARSILLTLRGGTSSRLAEAVRRA